MKAPPNGWSAVDLAVNSVAIWLGLILLLPNNVFINNPAFSVMLELAPEWLWGAGLFLVGLTGHVSRTWAWKWARLGALSAVAGAHFLFAICLILGNPFNTGSGTYLVIAALAFSLLMHETKH